MGISKSVTNVTESFPPNRITGCLEAY